MRHKAGAGGSKTWATAITPGWSTKVEYMYIELDDKPYVVSGASTGIDAHLTCLGVNGRF